VGARRRGASGERATRPAPARFDRTRADAYARAMGVVRDLARFAERAAWEDLSEEARRELRVRLLDSLGCSIGALGGPPIRALRAHVEDFGGEPRCGLLSGGRSAPDRAALWNGALVRYLDFNDSYLAPGETCHPSDCLGAVLAGAEYADATGRELLVAMAVSYQVQCRLSDEAPVRDRGFDHVTQGAYAWAAGTAKALGLGAEETANAVAIAGTALNALRVTRTGSLSHWKGLAAPHTAAAACQAAFLARRGITGPEEVFEGNKGFMDSVAGRRFAIDWEAEDLERVRRTILKKFNAEVHSQSAIEGILELREEHGFRAEDVERVELEVFDVAWNIIGGGEEGEKTEVRTKEEADHSLPYLLAVALLDGGVAPAQYEPERIAKDDVQALLRRVAVEPADDLSARFPEEHACRLRVTLRGGGAHETEKRDYEGFHTRPMAWETVVAKFEDLAGPRAPAELRHALVDAVEKIEDLPVAELAGLLARIPAPASGGPT